MPKLLDAGRVKALRQYFTVSLLPWLRAEDETYTELDGEFMFMWQLHIFRSKSAKIQFICWQVCRHCVWQTKFSAVF